MKRRLAALFLREGGQYPNSFLTTIVSVLDELGYDVHLFSANPPPAEGWEPVLDWLPVHYTTNWLARHAQPWRWRRYQVFLGTCEIPMAMVGWLSFLARRPSITICDEIFTGTYAGNLGARWKRWARTAMHKACATIITDPVRISLQQEYAGLPESHPFLVCPCAFSRGFTAGDVHAIRQHWGVPDNAFLLGNFGGLGHTWGHEWTLEALPSLTPDTWLVWKTSCSDPFLKKILAFLQRGNNLIVDLEHYTWPEVATATAAVEAHFALYLHDGPQFQHMGLSSQKLCLSLQMGRPVIASWQESLRFLEEWECGILVRSSAEIPEAVTRVRANHLAMTRNATKCANEFVDPLGRHAALLTGLARVLSSC